MNSRLLLTRAEPAPGRQLYASSSAVPLQQSPQHSVMLCWLTSQLDLAQEYEIGFEFAARTWGNPVVVSDQLEAVVRDLEIQPVQVLQVQEDLEVQEES